jgi:hypothetical protein
MFFPVVTGMYGGLRWWEQGHGSALVEEALRHLGLKIA